MGIMSGLAALGRVAGGVTQGLRMAEEDQKAREERDFQRGQRQRMLVQQGRDDQLQAELPAALEPVPAQPMDMAGPPTTEAIAAADAQNTPAAVGQRVMAAYTRAGRPTEGLRMRTDMQQVAAADAANADADKARRHRDFLRAGANALGQGWGTFAEFATKSYDDGKVYTAKENGKGGAIISVADQSGKTLGQQEFAGPEDAIMFLASRADPVKWVEYKTGRADKAKQVEQEDRKIKALEKTADARVEVAAAQAGAAQARAEASLARVAALGTTADAGKLPPAVKARFDADREDHKTLTTEIIKAQAGGMWNPEDPAAKRLLTQKATLELRMEQTLAPYMPKPAGDAGAPAADPLGLRGGGKPAAAAPGPAQPAAAEPPPDPTARRVKTTPVVDFTAGTGQRQRMNTARASLPDLEQAVKIAQQAVTEAKAKGPLAEQKARDLLSRAKTDLQMARDRAGE